MHGLLFNTGGDRIGRFRYGLDAGAGDQNQNFLLDFLCSIRDALIYFGG
jgi:hypothetical protein